VRPSKSNGIPDAYLSLLCAKYKGGRYTVSFMDRDNVFKAEFVDACPTKRQVTIKKNNGDLGVIDALDVIGIEN